MDNLRNIYSENISIEDKINKGFEYVKNILKSIDIIPANIKINKNNIIKLKNKVYVFSYEQSVYKLDLATLDLKKMITLKSKKEITSLCKITEDKIAFINSNKIF